MRHTRWAEPAPAVPPGICDGRVTNGQQSTDPNGASDQRPLVPSRPGGGGAQRRSNSRTGGDTKPARGRSTGKSKRDPGRARCANRYGSGRGVSSEPEHPVGGPVGDPLGMRMHANFGITP